MDRADVAFPGFTALAAIRELLGSHMQQFIQTNFHLSSSAFRFYQTHHYFLIDCGPILTQDIKMSRIHSIYNMFVYFGSSFCF